MARFNHKAKTIKTVNLDGWPAYALSGKELLATQALTSFVGEPKYYGDNECEIIEAAEKLAVTEPEFVAKLAVWARTVANMRSTSHMLCTVLAHVAHGNPIVRKAVEACVVRGDDVTEMLSAYLSLYGKPLPNSLRRGLASAMSRFSSYDVAKYQGKGRSLKMRDAIMLVHPSPASAELSQAFKDCLEGRLAVPESWETALSRDGNIAKTWESLIDGNHVPYMALLRNLRNIIKRAPSRLDVVLDRIADPEAVARSRQLPFRFYSAYRAVEEVASSKVFEALERALEASLAAYPRFDGRTVIAVDTSGSMQQGLSRRSLVSIANVAVLMGVCLAKLSDDAYLYTFSSDATKWPVSADGSILSQVRGIASDGYETNMASVFKRLIADGVDCDRIVILSDNQVNCDDTWFSPDTRGKSAVQKHLSKYRDVVGHDVWCFGWDMEGYGTTQFVGEKFATIAGWSEKVIPLISKIEAGAGSLVSEIESIDL